MKAAKWKTLTLLGTYTVMLQFLQGIVLAGPANRRSSRMIREVYPEIETEKLEGNQAEVCIVGDVVYGAEEPVPADQPCLKCKCQPPGVQCETTRCIKKPGCKAIHKPNKCCPEYQCECEHEGRFYANGERLETPPGGECRVCYCRGGEVQCAEVSCYIRTDCEGRTVPGQCCPKYDHCPPREPLVDRIIPSYTTQIPEASGYWPSTNISSSVEQTTTVYDQVQDITNEDTNKITETFFVDKATQTEPININAAEKRDAPKITIQEIIPEVKEIPITGPPKYDITVENKVSNKVDDEQDKEGDDLALADAESDSSEISEVYHHPPPVLKIGDQLLFLKKGKLVPGTDVSTPLPVITIIGAEGLQRGTEDSGETHEVHSQVQDPSGATATSQSTHIVSFVKPKNTKIEEDAITTTTSATTTAKSSLSTIEDFLLNLTKARSTTSEDDLYLDSLDPSTTIMMDNIVNKIKTLTNVESTTDVAHLVEKVYIADVEDANLNDTNATTWYEVKSSIGNDTSEERNITSIEFEDVENTTLSVLTEQVTPQIRSVSEKYENRPEAVKAKHEEDVAVVEQNPEYPPIPDIMSPQNVDEIVEHIDAELAQLSSEIPLNVSTQSEIETTTQEITTAENKTARAVVHPLINPNASLPLSLLRQAAPSDLHEAEEITTSTPEATEADRSKETLETNSQESDEAVTPNNQHASILSSVEDASVESTHGGSQELDTTDLVETVPGYEEKIAQNKDQKAIPTTTSVLLQTEDVEIIDTKALSKIKESIIMSNNSTKLIENKTRESKEKSQDPEADDIFKELNEELKTVPLNVIGKAGNEEAEAEAIFRELLEDATSSTLPPIEGGTSQPRNNNESQLLAKVSDVITKFQTKESKQSLDASILGILRDFFSSQYKYYGSTKKK